MRFGCVYFFVVFVGVVGVYGGVGVYGMFVFDDARARSRAFDGGGGV